MLFSLMNFMLGSSNDDVGGVNGDGNFDGDGDEYGTSNFTFCENNIIIKTFQLSMLIVSIASVMVTSMVTSK